MSATGTTQTQANWQMSIVNPEVERLKQEKRQREYAARLAGLTMAMAYLIGKHPLS